jgi:hypothetical protein
MTMTAWKQLLEKVLPDAKFHPPATVNEIVEIEKECHVTLPEDLTALLLEVNGVSDGEFGYAHLWSSERIIKENMWLHGDDIGVCSPAFTSVLFFADAGNGDNFGFQFDDQGRIASPDVYVWDHEEDSIRVIAPTLAQFVQGWFSGELSI